MKPLEIEVLAGKHHVHPFASEFDTVLREDGSKTKKPDGFGCFSIWSLHDPKGLATLTDDRPAQPRSQAARRKLGAPRG